MVGLEITPKVVGVALLAIAFIVGKYVLSQWARMSLKPPLSPTHGKATLNAG